MYSSSYPPGPTWIPRKPPQPGSRLTRGRTNTSPPAKTAPSLSQVSDIPPGEEDRSQGPSGAIPQMFKP